MNSIAIKSPHAQLLGRIEAYIRQVTKQQAVKAEQAAPQLEQRAAASTKAIVTRQAKGDASLAGRKTGDSLDR